jgi:hypothetical protein
MLFVYLWAFTTFSVPQSMLRRMINNLKDAREQVCGHYLDTQHTTNVFQNVGSLGPALRSETPALPSRAAVHSTATFGRMDCFR